VGLVKRSMCKTVGRKLLTVVHLQTLIKEIESVLNTRPLVYVANDIKSSMPIIPAHFLNMNPKSGIPNNEIPEESEFKPLESSAKKIATIWRKGQNLLDIFWKIWRDEYLTSLRERTQTQIKTGCLC